MLFRSQAYRLQVLDRAAAKPSASASAASGVTPLKAISPSEAQAQVPAPRRPQIEVFRLLPATLKLLVPTPGPEEEAKAALEAAAQAPQDGSGVVIEAPKAKPEAADKPAEGPPAPGPLDDAQIAQRDVALVELALLHALADDRLDDLADADEIGRAHV